MEPKGANDGAFLAAAKKMIVSSFGVLAWVVFTLSFPYGLTFYEIADTPGGLDALMHGMGQMGSVMGDVLDSDAGQDGAVVVFDMA